MMDYDKDKLKDLFQEIKPSEPSPGLEYRIMQQVNSIVAQQNQRASQRDNAFSLIAILASIVAVLALPALVLYIIGWSPDASLSGLKTSFATTFSSFNIDGSIIVIVAIGLTLLIGDLLIRKHLDEKNAHKKTH